LVKEVYVAGSFKFTVLGGSLESFWTLKVVNDLEARSERPIVFSTAKTPSGPIHIGFGRELVYCDVLCRMLKDKGHKTEWVFFIDDFDSLKNFPPSIPQKFKTHKEYLGRPMWMVPCPYGCCESWAQHYAEDLTETFPMFGFHPKIFWTHEIYMKPEMKALIRKAIAERDKIRNIMVEVVAPTLSGEKLELFMKEFQDWYPCLVVCENCERLMTTRVKGYNAENDALSYQCKACGHEGEVEISKWPVKLRWRIDWPAKWALFKVSCEPAGKDHCVKGGAYDTGERIVAEIFGWKPPYRIPYEWILLGEKAMKTHKGISFTFAEWLKVASPEIYRYMVLREDPKKHISFTPERIPQLIDEFERLEKIYFEVEKASSQVENTLTANIYPFCFPDSPPSQLPARLPYRFAVILSQLKSLLGEADVKKKTLSVLRKLAGREPSSEEISDASRRLKMAEYWVANYADERFKISISRKVSEEVKRSLSTEERNALKELIKILEQKDWKEEELQYEIFEIGKRFKIGTKIFEAVYKIFLGKSFGPRLAPFLLSLERDFVVRRLKEAVGLM
jgi:lysyl-tRNA synthetase class 1